MLNAPLVARGDVGRFAPRADGGRVIYIADQDEDEDQDETVELCSLELTPRKPRRVR